MAYEDRNFEILRGQCLSIASKALIHAGVNLESDEGMNRLFVGGEELLKKAMQVKFLESSPKDYAEKKVEEKPSESLPGHCAGCGGKVSEKESDYSQRHYGKPYCYECQKKVKKIG